MTASRQWPWLGPGLGAVALAWWGISGMSHRPSHEFPPFEVEYAFCDDVLLDEQPRCVFEADQQLVLWTDRQDFGDFAVLVDGTEVDPVLEHEPTLPGSRLRVTLPSGSMRLEFQLDGEPTPWTLLLVERGTALAEASSAPTREQLNSALTKAWMTSAQGHHQEALEALEALAKDLDRYPRGRSDLQFYRGVIKWRLGRFWDAALDLRDAHIFALKVNDRDLLQASTPMYAADLAELGYAEAAQFWADRAAIDVAGDDSQSCAAGSSVRGKILSTVGWAHLAAALHRGESLRKAREILDAGISIVAPGGPCPNREIEAGIVLSLANADLHQRLPDQALERLEAIDLRAATLDVQLRLRDAALRARIELGQPTEELDAALRALELAVAQVGTTEGQWRLALRRGRLLELRGDLRSAVEVYRKAEGYALEITSLAALGVGRESVSALHRQSTEGLIRALVALGRRAEAFCAAREAQARRIQAVPDKSLGNDFERQELDKAISQYADLKAQLDAERLHQLALPERLQLAGDLSAKSDELAMIVNTILRGRSTWRPTCDELTPALDDEVLIGIYPFDRGWWTFAHSDLGTQARWVPIGPAQDSRDPRLGAKILAPWSHHLERARLVRVLASGRAQEIDVHLLEWKDEALIEHVPVVYGAELPAMPPRAAPETPHAVLLADPTRSLPHAQEDVKHGARVLRAAGWRSSSLSHDNATPTSLVKLLRSADLFFYAGHAAHDTSTAGSPNFPPYAAGTRGWQARLFLKPPTQLEASDILLLDNVPADVLLMGCQTGVAGFSNGGMSLALAFLVAGSRSVIATPQRTTDELSSQLAYQLFEGVGYNNIGQAFQRATTHRIRSGLEVGRYRVWCR